MMGVIHLLGGIAIRKFLGEEAFGDRLNVGFYKHTFNNIGTMFSFK